MRESWRVTVTARGVVTLQPFEPPEPGPGEVLLEAVLLYVSEALRDGAGSR